MNQSCSCRQTELIGMMRLLWSQHVYWTRFFIISTAENLSDIQEVTERLLENPNDFAMALKPYYGVKTAQRFQTLLTEHLKIGGDLVNAAKNADAVKANDLRRKWYENANEIAAFLACINSFWCENKWRKMLYSHLEMTEKEAGLRLNKEYRKDIAIFGQIEAEAMTMADDMSAGIIRQFLCK